MPRMRSPSSQNIVGIEIQLQRASSVGHVCSPARGSGTFSRCSDSCCAGSAASSRGASPPVASIPSAPPPPAPLPRTPPRLIALITACSPLRRAVMLSCGRAWPQVHRFTFVRIVAAADAGGAGRRGAHPGVCWRCRQSRWRGAAGAARRWPPSESLRRPASAAAGSPSARGPARTHCGAASRAVNARALQRQPAARDPGAHCAHSFMRSARRCVRGMCFFHETVLPGLTCPGAHLPIDCVVGGWCYWSACQLLAAQQLWRGRTENPQAAAVGGAARSGARREHLSSSVPGWLGSAAGRKAACCTSREGRVRRHNGGPPRCSARCRISCAVSGGSPVNTL